jgi:RNA polymerase sigma-70 factor (ECF subfamily)
MPAARARFAAIVVPRLDDGYRLARWLTGNAADAEDIVQEASLRAFRAIESLAEGNPRAWFLTIVRHCCYSWLERHRPRGTVFSEDLGAADRGMMEAGGLDAPPPATPETSLIAKDDADRLAQAIEALPVPLREALVLREMHGLSYREIAAVTGVPMGTVMSRLARARQHLLTRFATDRS